jgi:hypothetical protein
MNLQMGRHASVDHEKRIALLPFEGTLFAVEQQSNTARAGADRPDAWPARQDIAPLGVQIAYDGKIDKQKALSVVILPILRHMETNMRKGILLFWPSFIIAVLATVVFYSVFDPAELTLHGHPLFADKLTAYSVFMLISWAFGALNTSIVLLLEKSARDINGFAPPPVISGDEDGSPT